MPEKYIPSGTQEEIIQKICALESKLAALSIEYWEEYVLFQPQWWILLALLILPWIFWWKLLDKEHFFRITFFGWAAAFIATESDIIGSQLGLWHYQYQLQLFSPKLSAIDFAVFPVVYMLVYQYFRDWKSYLIAGTVIALAFAFAGEPLLVYLGIYKLNSWKHWYSFPLYISIFIFLKWLVDTIAFKVLPKSEHPR